MASDITGSGSAPEVTDVTMSARAQFAYRNIRALLNFASRAWLRVEVHGSERIPPTGGFVLAPGGHRSILDTPMASLASDRILRYMGAETYFKMPVLGSFLRSAGGFPVERAATDREAMRIAEMLLANGEPLVVFPEGTRQTGPLIQPLKQGAAFMACRAGVPIVPVGVGGAERAMPKGRKYARPTKIVLVVGEPIVPPNRPARHRVKRSTIRELSDQLAEELQQLFDQAQTMAGA